jgi:hypothetical protein
MTRPLEVPAGLDGAQVLDAVRNRFMRLQAAWDAGDVSTLRSLTTPDMLEELLHMLTARGSGPSRTDVISLHAETARARGARRRVSRQRRVLRPDPRIGRTRRRAVSRTVDARLHEGRNAFVATRATTIVVLNRRQGVGMNEVETP